MLHLTGTTLNIESFMGAIMSIGVSVANSILMVTFAERLRKESGNATKAAVDGAQSRLRPILMTTGAMVVGMIPMALGHGDSGQQSAPLGRAVIGGLLLSTVSTLFILPFVFSAAQNRRTTDSASIDPTDPESRYAGA
jgi:multidrug efflux pump subunit AcrB